jgi:hypothetical protein
VTNLVPNQYREVSLTSVDFTLTVDQILGFLSGREVYQRTRYVVLRHGPDTAVVEVTKAPGTQLMAVVTGVSVLAGPDECVFVTAPDVDTGIPTSLARAARQEAPSARGVVVEGRYHHINFILDPAPLAIRVLDVVPPGPPKLVDQAERMLAVAEEIPPLELVADVVDLAELARSNPAPRYLLPCRGSGFSAGGAQGIEVAFLDERPPRQDWTLIGCNRSRQLHRWFYGDLPDTVEMCPRALAAGGGGAGGGRAGGGGGPYRPAVTLTKCCLLENRIDCDGSTVVVPWGASLEQVRQGLQLAAELAAELAAAQAARPGEPEAADQAQPETEAVQAEDTWAPA